MLVIYLIFEVHDKKIIVLFHFVFYNSYILIKAMCFLDLFHTFMDAGALENKKTMNMILKKIIIQKVPKLNKYSFGMHVWEYLIGQGRFSWCTVVVHVQSPRL